MQEGDLYNAQNMDNLEDRVKEAFIALGEFVADGKNAIASAITGKGVLTAVDAAFAVMAENIRKIKTTPTITSQRAVFFSADSDVDVRNPRYMACKTGRKLFSDMFPVVTDYRCCEDSIPDYWGRAIEWNYNPSNGRLTHKFRPNASLTVVVYYID